MRDVEKIILETFIFIAIVISAATIIIIKGNDLENPTNTQCIVEKQPIILEAEDEWELSKVLEEAKGKWPDPVIVRYYGVLYLFKGEMVYAPDNVSLVLIQRETTFFDDWLKTKEN